MFATRIVTSLLAVLCWFAVAAAIETSDFQVNEEDYPGAFKQDRLNVADDGQGNHVVCWRDFRGEEPLLYFQRCDATGGLVGDNVEICPVTESSGERVPGIAMNASGQFVVAYRDHWTKILLRRFAADGTPYGDPVLISDTAFDIAAFYNLAVAMNDQGEGVVVFQVHREGESDMRVLGQYFDYTTGAVGDNFIVSELKQPSWNHYPEVVITEYGHIFCLWVGSEEPYTNVGYNRFRYLEAPPLPEQYLDTSYVIEDEYRYIAEQGQLSLHPNGTICCLWTGVYWEQIGFNSYSYTCDTSFATLIDTSGAVLLSKKVVVDNTMLPQAADTRDMIARQNGFGAVGQTWEDSLYLFHFDLNGDFTGGPYFLAAGDGDNHRDGTRLVPLPGDVVAVVWGSYYGATNPGDILSQGFQWNGSAGFPVTYLHDDVGAPQTFPVIAFDSSGASLALWIDERQSSGGEVWGQRYDAQGMPVGGNFKVSEESVRDINQLDVSAHAGHRIAVVWVRSTTTSGNGVECQLFDYPNFTPVGGNFEVFHAGGWFDYYWPKVDVAADGSFVVAFRRQFADDTTGVFMRPYDETGSPLSDPVKVNDSPGEEINMGYDGLHFEYSPCIAVHPDGAFVIAWFEKLNLGGMPFDTYDVVAQFYSSSATPLFGNIVVSDSSGGVASISNEEIPPDIAVNEFGEYAIAWTGGGFSGYEGVWARVYNSTGVPLGEQLHYCDLDIFNFNPPARLVAGPNHEFVGIWYTGNGDDADVYGQRFNGADGLIGVPVLAVDEPTAAQSYPVAAAIGSQVGIVWEDFRDGTALDGDIFAKYTDWSGFGGICGDVDGDGEGPNIADVSYLVAYLFSGGPPPPIEGAADTDGDGSINVADLTALVSYLFDGGPLPTCAPVE